jgi:hypothetical protein
MQVAIHDVFDPSQHLSRVCTHKMRQKPEPANPRVTTGFDLAAVTQVERS